MNLKEKNISNIDELEPHFLLDGNYSGIKLDSLVKRRSQQGRFFCNEL